MKRHGFAIRCLGEILFVLQEQFTVYKSLGNAFQGQYRELGSF